MQPTSTNPEIKYQKLPKIDEQCIDNDVLLMSLTAKRVVILNASSSILWTLLSHPMSFEELTDFYKQANPASPLLDIASAIQLVLTELLNADLIKVI